MSTADASLTGAPAEPALASTGTTVTTSGGAPPKLPSPPRAKISPTFRSDEHRRRNVVAQRAKRNERTRPRASLPLLHFISGLDTRRPWYFFNVAKRATQARFLPPRSQAETRRSDRESTKDNAHG